MALNRTHLSCEFQEAQDGKGVLDRFVIVQEDWEAAAAATAGGDRGLQSQRSRNGNLLEGVWAAVGLVQVEIQLIHSVNAQPLNLLSEQLVSKHAFTFNLQPLRRGNSGGGRRLGSDWRVRLCCDDVAGLYKLNSFDPQLETVRLQPLSLPLDPS
jgi:hypothetical protein